MCMKKNNNRLLRGVAAVLCLALMFLTMSGMAMATDMEDAPAGGAPESTPEIVEAELPVTPEGTRSKVETWKRGFYYIALKANLPILLYALDYSQKKIVCTRTILPSGNVDEDMRSIMQYYAQFQGKHPEKFTIEKL